MLELLRSLGLIRPADFVDRGVSTLALSSAGWALAVRCAAGSGYLVKRGVGREGRSALAREAKVYGLLTRHVSPEGLAPHLPRVYAYRPREGLLVLELLPASLNLVEHVRRTGLVSRSLASALGRALSALHRIPAAEGFGPRRLDEPPWVLRTHEPSRATIRAMSAASRSFLRLSQGCDDLCSGLDVLHRDWEAVCIIHRDLRWENLVVSRGPPLRGALRIHVVDWELAGPGDPTWDVGSVLGGFLCFWATSLPLSPHDPLDALVRLARFPLSRVQPAIRSFWSAYAAGSPDASSDFLGRAVRFAAAWILQHAYERLQQEAEVTQTEIYLLQLGRNILRRPEDAAATLLGLGP